MAVKSLPGKQKKPTASTSKQLAGASTLSSISQLAALLPPCAPASASLNPLADLVQLYADLPLALALTAGNEEREANRQEVHMALHSIKAVFEALIKQGRLHGVLKTAKRVKLDTTEGRKEVAKEDEIVQKVKAWLNERWQDYLEATAKVAGGHWDGTVRLSALNALMSLVRTESMFLTSLDPARRARFARSTFSYVVRALLLPPTEDGTLDPDVLEEWKKWWDRCDDVRLFFLEQAAALLSTYSRAGKPASSRPPPPVPSHLIPNTITVLESLTTMPTVQSEINEWFCAIPAVKASNAAKKRKADEDDPRADGSTGIFDSSSSESEAEPDIIRQLSSQQRKKNLPKLLSLVAHRRVFQDCWFALLSLPIREEDSKRVLIMLHRQVLPHLTEPKRLEDWLVDCADKGGTVGILALNGLFTLMQKHKLEYFGFYTKLYSLLDRSVLHVRYRPRFFRLLEIFMGSLNLSSNLVASFAKRLSRLALSAFPAAIVTVVPFVYNLLKRHPSCMVLIHRSSEGDDYNWSNDPYDANEPDPENTGALDSSLWELAALQKHYLASVSSLAKVFGEAMNKQAYSMEDFLDHSYATLIETELARKITNRPPALAPVPKRQPIRDSFFPHAGGEGTEAEEQDEEEEPVDIVSALWSF
ncbi:Maturation and nuclear export of 40S ribosomal subunits interacting protein [Rhodotorula toruloides]